MSSFERIDTAANRLREAMQLAGKRQADIVRETGIDKGALSHYLKGRYEPKQDVVYKLAKALDVSEMWLWGYDCDRARTEEQKNNDALSDIIVRLRTDPEFFRAVVALSELEPSKLAVVVPMLSALVE